MKAKQIITVLAASAMLFSAPAQAADEAKCVVNGAELADKAYIIDDKVYVPLRAVGEAMGADISWDNESRTASLASNEDARAVSVINSVSESVVAIVGNYKSRDMSPSAQDYNELYAHGAGVVIKSSGTILTNAHVVEDIENITVIFGTGETYSATVLFSDSTSDLAIVKINKLGLKPIQFAREDSVRVGESVIAIGTPLSINHINSASRGIVSGLNVNIGAPYLFTQSDVAINGGNSGGPLVNLNGELIGINSRKYVGSDVEGMSFSIPLNTINYVLESYEKYGKVLRPETGVILTESWESKIGVPTTKGLTVTSSRNPALLAGDMVTNVNGRDVHSIADYNEALKTYIGGSITFTYTRAGASQTVELSDVSLPN